MTLGIGPHSSIVCILLHICVCETVVIWQHFGQFLAVFLLHMHKKNGFLSASG